MSLRSSWSALLVCALVATVSIVAPASASEQPSCASGTNPYDASNVTLSNCGYLIHPLSSKTTLPDGGSSYTYDINGGSVTFNVPPKDFSPVDANSTQLNTYGLPPRPDASAGLSYSAWVTKYENVDIQTPPPSLISAPIVSTPLISHNWSGYIATNSSSTYFNFANTEYVQPSNAISACTGGTGISVGSIWAGLGGDTPAKDLAQDGTYFGSNDSSLAADGQFWFEFAPDAVDIDSSGSQLSDLLPDVADPGDIVEASVSYNSGVNYSLDLYDVTNGDYYDLTANAPAHFTPDGSSAEFIIETPAIYSTSGTFLGYSNLPDFDSDNFNYASVGHSTSIAYLSTYSHQSVTMEPGSTPYATGGSLGNDSVFTDTYHACSG